MPPGECLAGSDGRARNLDFRVVSSRPILGIEFILRKKKMSHLAKGVHKEIRLSVGKKLCEFDRCYPEMREGVIFLGTQGRCSPNL